MCICLITFQTSVKNSWKETNNCNTLQDYLSTLGRERFRGDRYHLFENNCNNFSDVVARHLTGNGIPSYILQLPEMVKNSPIAQLIAPIIEQARKWNKIKMINTPSSVDLVPDSHRLPLPPNKNDHLMITFRPLRPWEIPSTVRHLQPLQPPK